MAEEEEQSWDPVVQEWLLSEQFCWAGALATTEDGAMYAVAVDGATPDDAWAKIQLADHDEEVLEEDGVTTTTKTISEAACLKTAIETGKAPTGGFWLGGEKYTITQYDREFPVGTDETVTKLLVNRPKAGVAFLTTKTSIVAAWYSEDKQQTAGNAVKCASAFAAYLIGTYVGGMECCRDKDIILDADQEVPSYVDEIRWKWRFYHEPFDAAKHTPIMHLEWAVNGCDSGGPQGNPKNCRHIEFDVPQAPPGTPPQHAIANVTSHFQVKDMLAPNGCSVETDPYCADAKVAAARGGAIALIMAGGHCHSPACLSLELYNDETGELLCQVSPRMGKGDKAHDEDGYIWLPPCQWGHEPHLRPPPVLPLETRLRAVKRANSTNYHYGVMGIFQMRGAYLPAEVGA